MAPPFHTIIVPTYNQAQYIGAALDSILAQTDPSWEAIVVNDGSTDTTAEIIDSYARRDSRFVAVHKANGGVGSALNAGLARAQGKWIHWLSSDDMFEPKKLSINRQWIDRYPECKFFFSYFTLLREATGARERRELWGPIPHPEQQILSLFYRNSVSGISICIERNAWRKAGYFDESLRYAQDFDQWLRILQQNQAMFIPEWTVINRNHALQGSEIFPDACYFETTKAAVRFINANSFPQLVPWANLSELASALSAVNKALDVAFERSSYLYCLGPHPALALRVLEWVYSGEIPDSVNAAVLRAVVQDRVRQQAYQPEADSWQTMWQNLAAAISAPNATFRYCPIDEMGLIQRIYSERDYVPGAIAAPQGAPPMRVAAMQGTGRVGGFTRVVVLLPLGADEALRRSVQAIARELGPTGVRSVILDEACPGYEWDGYVTTIRRQASDLDKLAWLSPADVLCVFGEAAPIWLKAQITLSLDSADTTWPTTLKAEVDEITSASSDPARTQPVAILQRVLQGGGAERVVFDLVARLDRRRYKPHVLTLFECGPDPEYPPDVPVICVRNFPPRQAVQPVEPAAPASADPGPPPPPAPIPSNLHAATLEAFDGHLPAAEGLRTVLSSLGPDVALLAFMEEATIAAWLAKAGTGLKFISSLHCVESAYFPQLWPDQVRRQAQSWALASACTTAELVTFPTDGCKDDLVVNFGVRPDLINTIGNPVDCARIRRLSLDPSQDLSVTPEDRFTFVSLGRLDPEKNHDLLIEACALLASQRRDFIVLCVGSGSEEARLKQLVSDRGLDDQLKFIGKRNNPFPLLRRADGLVLTSRLEAFALVLVEAMVCGVPVVSVDCPHGPREVLANGEAGLLTPFGDAAALAAGMSRLIDDGDLRQRLIRRGLERAHDFDIGPIAAKWEDAIDRLLPPRSATRVGMSGQPS